MQTLKKIQYNLLNLIQAGRASDDALPSLRLLTYWFNNYREVLIKQQDGKGNTIDSVLLQTIGCLPVSLVDAAECCEITTCHKVLRTTNKIPQLVELSHSDGIQYVGSIVQFSDEVDNENPHAVVATPPFQRVTNSQVPFVGYDKYVGKFPKWYYNNGHIYILNNTTLKYISISGIFADPTELANFKNCNGTNCYDDNSLYPVPGYMINTITDMIRTRELPLFFNSITDNSNNANNSKD